MKLRVALSILCVVACQRTAPTARELPTPAPAASTAVLPGRAASLPPAHAAAAGFRCNLLLGVAVTREWFEAGFEQLAGDERWELVSKPHTSLTEWGDASDPVWSLEPSSPCSEQPSAPDRVLFTAMKWEYTSAEEWAAGLRAVVQAIRVHFPNVRQIELLTMIRAPHNASCGNAMSVVQPFVDQAVSLVASEHPDLVKVGARHEAPSCDLFKDGGPHFTEPGRLEIARQLGAYYASEPQP